MAVRAGKQQKFRKADKMKDYSESLIELKKLTKEYQNACLKNEFERAADIAVDMGVLCCELQEWSEIKLEESR